MNNRCVPGDVLRRLVRHGEFTYVYEGHPAREVTERDIVGALLSCDDPECPERTHRIVSAAGPYPGFNPGLGRPDLAYLVTLDNGKEARFWTDEKVIVDTTKTISEPKDPETLDIFLQ